MLTSIQTVTIIIKAEDKQASTLGHDIDKWLRAHGLRVCILNNVTHEANIFCKMTPASDLVLVLGGDGTMLSVARLFLGSCTPLLGVNLGKVGFLTEIAAVSWQESLNRLLAQGARLLELPVLTWVLERGGRTLIEGQAVNDLVVNRGILARLVNLKVCFENETIGPFRCDGLIAATPIGSTAYVLSAGGPLLHPSLDAWCLVPICPFLSQLRPLVLPGIIGAEVVVLDSTAQVHLSLDGQEGFCLQQGDRLHIKRSLCGIILATLSNSSWLTKLKDKGLLSNLSSSEQFC